MDRCWPPCGGERPGDGVDDQHGPLDWIEELSSAWGLHPANWALDSLRCVLHLVNLDRWVAAGWCRSS